MSFAPPPVPPENAPPATAPLPAASDAALVDDLTGLYNRRYLRQLFESEWNELLEREGRVALLLIDLDLFKEINDSYGHLAGDAVLRAVAQRLRESFREGDRVVRFGGDEFVIVLPGVGEEEARRLAERARAALASERWTDPASGRAIELPLSFSIGAAAAPGGGPFGEDVLALADRELYEEKRSRRGRLAEVLAPSRRRVLSRPLALAVVLAVAGGLAWLVGQLRTGATAPPPAPRATAVTPPLAAEELLRREREIRALREEVERLRGELAHAGSTLERERFTGRLRELEVALAERAAAAPPATATAVPDSPPAALATTPAPPPSAPTRAPDAGAETSPPARALIVVPPQLVSHRPPVYPPLARARGLEAQIEFRVRVAPDGRVMVLEPLGPRAGNGFDEAAREAALSARYRPGTRDGEPVEMDTTLRIEFKMAAERGR